MPNAGLKDQYRDSQRDRNAVERKAAASALAEAAAAAKAKEEEKARDKEKEEKKAAVTGMAMTVGDNAEGSIAAVSMMVPT